MRKRNPLLLAVLCVFPVLVLFVIWYTGVLGRFGFGRDTATKAGELSVYFLDVGRRQHASHRRKYVHSH